MKDFLDNIVKENLEPNVNETESEVSSVSVTYAIQASELPYDDASDSVELKNYEKVLDIIKQGLDDAGASNLKVESIEFRGVESNNGGTVAYYGFKLSGPIEVLKSVVGEEKPFFGSFENQTDEAVKNWKSNLDSYRNHAAFGGIVESYDRYVK